MSAVGGGVLLGASSRKLDVICNLAHDLRQPLSAIEAIAYYLERTLPEDQREARQYMLRLQELVETSSTILSDALDAARGPGRKAG
jgi:signal transduction histidine kinase